jgi:thiamine transport system permease protein
MESEIFIQAVRLGDTRTATALAAVQAVIVGSVLFLTHRFAGSATLALQIRTPRALSTKPRNRFIVLFFASASCAMVAAPMIATIQRSFFARGQFSTTAWRSIFSGDLPSLAISTHHVIGTSLVFALFAAIVCIPLALLAATALSTKQALLGAVTSLPLAISAATVGIGLIITFDSDPVAWRGEQWLIPVIHALIALPLAIRVLEPAISSVPVALRHAAATLGANPLRTWTRVELPIVKPALLRASGLAMATSLGEFGATSFLSRTNSTTLPLAIAQMLGRPGVAVQQAGFALASLMIIITVGIMSRA